MIPCSGVFSKLVFHHRRVGLMVHLGHSSPHMSSLTGVYWKTRNDAVLPRVFGTRSS
jgi:hypothetical protein